MTKAPIYFEIAAEGGMGKTHTSITAFPRPFIVDTTPRGDGKFTAMKVFKDEFDQKYFHAPTLLAAINVINDVIASGKFATLVVDEYSGLRKLGQEWYLKTFNKKSVFPTTEWGVITKKINNEVLWSAQDHEMNVVVTSGFHDVYIKGEMSGGKASNSPPNANLDIDYRLMLAENKDKTDVDAIIVKNKFVSIKERHKKIPYPITWETIKKEIGLTDIGFEYCE